MAVSTREVVTDLLRQSLEVAESVAIPGYKVGVAFLDVSERSATVDLQFESVLVRMEWFRRAKASPGSSCHFRADEPFLRR